MRAHSPRRRNSHPGAIKQIDDIVIEHDRRNRHARAELALTLREETHVNEHATIDLLDRLATRSAPARSRMAASGSPIAFARQSRRRPAYE